MCGISTAKGILQRSKVSHEDPKLAMLVYRATPVGKGLLSSTQLLAGHKYRALIPVKDLKYQAQVDNRESRRSKTLWTNMTSKPRSIMSWTLWNKSDSRWLSLPNGRKELWCKCLLWRHQYPMWSKVKMVTSTNIARSSWNQHPHQTLRLPSLDPIETNHQMPLQKEALQCQGQQNVMPDHLRDMTMNNKNCVP